MGNVMVIPAKRQIGNIGRKQDAKPKLRVAAYCRVSTDSDEQATSYEAQVEHYTEYIKKNPEWEFAGLYADDGISGTNTKNREEFNRLIEDCEAGTIDMIITKSISRFARNTLDCLKYIRQLKEKNIPVFFEKEYIQSRLYLAQPLNIACFLLGKYYILWFCTIINQGFVSFVACLSLKSIK